MKILEGLSAFSGKEASIFLSEKIRRRYRRGKKEGKRSLFKVNSQGRGILSKGSFGNAE